MIINVLLIMKLIKIVYIGCEWNWNINVFTVIFKSYCADKEPINK